MRWSLAAGAVAAALAVLASLAAAYAIPWLPVLVSPQQQAQQATFFAYGMINATPFGGEASLSSFALPTQYFPVAGAFAGYVELNGTIYEASGTYYISRQPFGYSLGLSGIAAPVGQAAAPLGASPYYCTFHAVAQLSNATSGLFGTISGYAYCEGEVIPFSGYLGLARAPAPQAYARPVPTPVVP